MGTVLKPLSVLVLALSLALPLKAQQPGISSTSTDTSSITVSGVVLNAITGKPISRALVRISDRALLTDHEGRFEFPQYASSSAATLQVNKPGYYLGTDTRVGAVTLQPSQLASPITVRLYPEALITGTITAPDSSPLSQIYINAFRSTYNEIGHQWEPVAHSITNSRGEFRLAVPPGNYRISTNFSPRQRNSSNIIFPLVLPAPGSSGDVSLIHMSPGSEQHFDLHPATSPTHQVSLRIDPAPERGFPMLTARTSDGTLLPVSTIRPGSFAGDDTRISLPSGTITLSASINNGEVVQYGEVTVTVPDHDLEGVVLHLSPVAPIPIQVVYDSSSTPPANASASTAYSSPPSINRFGLVMQNTDDDLRPGTRSFAAISMNNQQPSLRLMPGSYRLNARAAGEWYIRSATWGTTDLLQQEMSIVAGAGSSPIIITVSNQTGSLQGTVRLNGVPGSYWIAAVPTGASATPSFTASSNASGSFSFPYLPPGNYQVIAFERRYMTNFRDPQSLAPFNTYVKSATVTVGNKSSLDLDAVPSTELNP